MVNQALECKAVPGKIDINKKATAMQWLVS